MFGGFKGIITEITQSNLIKNTKAENILELETTNVKTAWGKKNVGTVVTSSMETAGSLEDSQQQKQMCWPQAPP